MVATSNKLGGGFFHFGRFPSTKLGSRPMSTKSAISRRRKTVAAALDKLGRRRKPALTLKESLEAGCDTCKRSQTAAYLGLSTATIIRLENRDLLTKLRPYPGAGVHHKIEEVLKLAGEDKS
jgi:hypothetical protein